MAGVPSAGQAIAVEGEAIERAEDRGGNLFGAEKFLGEGLDVFAGDGVDGGEDFVEGEEAAEIEFLPREIGHAGRSEEHTSELQSRLHLVCRLLLEKKNSRTMSRQSRNRIAPVRESARSCVGNSWPRCARC